MTDLELHALAKRIASGPYQVFATDLAEWALRLEKERDHLKHQDGLLNSVGRQAVDRAVKAEAALAQLRDEHQQILHEYEAELKARLANEAQLAALLEKTVGTADRP